METFWQNLARVTYRPTLSLPFTQIFTFQHTQKAREKHRHESSSVCLRCPGGLSACGLLIVAPSSLPKLGRGDWDSSSAVVFSASHLLATPPAPKPSREIRRPSSDLLNRRPSGSALHSSTGPRPDPRRGDPLSSGWAEEPCEAAWGPSESKDRIQGWFRHSSAVARRYQRPRRREKVSLTLSIIRLFSRAAKGWAYLWVEVDEGQEEVGHVLCVLHAELVLLVQHVLEAPVLEVVDVLELASPVEEVFGELPRHCQLLRVLAWVYHGTAQYGTRKRPPPNRIPSRHQKPSALRDHRSPLR